MNIPAGTKIPLVVTGASDAIRTRAQNHEDTLKRLARLDSLTFAKAAPKGAAIIVAGDTTAAIPLAGVIDMGAEKKRLEKEVAAANVDIGKMDAKLSNPNFMAKADPEAIEAAQERKAELADQVKRLSAALKRLEV